MYFGFEFIYYDIQQFTYIILKFQINSINLSYVSGIVDKVANVAQATSCC